MALDTVSASPKVASVVTESRLARWALILLSLVFLLLILFLPLAAVFVEAFRKGVPPFFQALQDAETFSAIRLTLIVAGVSDRGHLSNRVSPHHSEAGWVVIRQQPDILARSHTR